MANDVYECRLFWSDPAGKRGENVMHFTPVSSPSSTDPFVIAKDLITALELSLIGDLLACVSTTVTLSAISAKKVNNGGGPTYTSINGSPGTRSGNEMTGAVAANLAFIPSVGPYLRKLGRIFIGGLVETDVIGDVIQSALQVLINQVITDLQGSFVGTYATYVVTLYDRSTDIATAISDFVLRPTISALRRRLRPRNAS